MQRGPKKLQPPNRVDSPPPCSGKSKSSHLVFGRALCYSSFCCTVHAFPIVARESRAKGREPNHQTSSCRLCVTHDQKTDINERKPVEYCPRSNRVEAGITEYSLSRAAQNDRVLLARRRVPPHDAKRSSRVRNKFDGEQRRPAQAKLKNPRAPNHFAPRARNHTRKIRDSASLTCCSKPRGGIVRSRW